MARRARRQQPKRAPATKRSPAIPRDEVIDALMALLATRSLARVGLADIAEAAGVQLATLRELYDNKFAIIADFSRRIDQAVLDGGPAEGETARDRVFEIVMRRFDALGPHKDAVRSLTRSARRDLCLARLLQRNARRSQSWMLAAANAEVTGPLRVIAISGLALVYSDALRVWLDDDDPGLARTMAALDRGLQRGARAMSFLDDVCGRVRSFTSRDRATRRGAAATG